MITKKLHFNKPALPINDQLEVLKAKGLQVSNEQSAKRYLKTVGYFRLSQYCKAFQNESDVNFDQVRQVYSFDRKLRLQVLDAVEQIEVALRAAISNIMSLSLGSLWYLDPTNFKIPYRHDKFLDEINRIVARKEKPFIKHYMETYATPGYPPGWMIMECLSLGMCSRLFKNLADRKAKKSIADIFMVSIPLLESWLRSLTEIRNYCAHHDRIWNRTFSCLPKNVPAALSCRNRFSQQAYVIAKLLNAIEPESKWLMDVFQLAKGYGGCIKLKDMGFTLEWANDPLWKCKVK